MADRPILFSGPMVRALIEGRKTQTRRRVKARDLGFDNEDVMDFPAELLPFDFAGAKCPYGKPGDLLWVRETCCPDWAGKPVYKADGGSAREAGYPAEPRWRSSIHMPRWASRLTLRITEVRVQRLKDCSNADAVAEGIGTPTDMRYAASEGYRFIWEEINGPGSWDANPWVWAITFDVIQLNIDAVLLELANAPEQPR